jgi:transcriptional regulator with XRE-family HTH domain
VSGHTWVRTLGADVEERDAFLRAFGGHLRERRHAAGLSQEQLAARTFASREQIYTVESGRTAPTVPFVALLGVAVGEPSDGLLANIEPPTRRHSRERALAILAQRPEIATDQIAEAMGLPWSYVIRTMRYLQADGVVMASSAGWRLVDSEGAR